MFGQVLPVVISSRPGLALSWVRVRPNWYGPAPSVENSIRACALGVGLVDGRAEDVVPFDAGEVLVVPAGGGVVVGELQPAAPNAAAVTRTSA